MKNFRNLFLLTLTAAALTLSGCLHVLEEVTFKNNGSGSYKMTLDMSEVKSMMDMFKGMAPDSLSGGDSTAVAGGAESNPMGQMGDELSNVAETLKNVPGLSNVKPINDTAAFQFGYSFDFVDVAALNKAMRIINKEKYETNVDEVFKFNGKSFERLAEADMGEQIKKALAEGEESEMDMMKTFFADMSYKQIYHFPDRDVKKSSHELSEISGDGHTLTITLKPFDEEQQKKKLNVGTVVKLK